MEQSDRHQASISGSVCISQCSRGPTPARAGSSRFARSPRPQALPIRRFGINHVHHGSGVRRLITMFVLVLAFFPVLAGAEYTRVELKIFGMDCAICAHGVRVAVQKVEGVESVELSLERAQADIRLRAGNRVTLDRFRQIVKGNGFEPKEAAVTAIGTVRDSGGKLVFEVTGAGSVLIVSLDKTPAGVVGTLKRAVEAKTPTALEVSGTVTVGKDGSETMAVATANARP
jgi:copper chaperone CopZ